MASCTPNAIDITQVGLHYRGQWWQRHPRAQIETGVGVLIVATGGTVATIMRVLLQAVDTEVSRQVSAVSHDSRAVVIALLCQNHFFTPIADNVTHESRSCACGGHCSPIGFS